jgi:hypothetical protein
MYNFIVALCENVVYALWNVPFGLKPFFSPDPDSDLDLNLNPFSFKKVLYGINQVRA